MRVYILGSKGIPASYGGFETFVDRLVSGNIANIEYVVTGMSDKNEQYKYEGARCIQFATPNNVFGRMSHTLRALFFVFKDSKSVPKSIVYILGCRAGIFLPFFRPFLKHRNVKILVNPDGAEWKRAKWNPIAKLIVLVFEHLLVKSSDTVVCDSRGILDIMQDDFRVKANKLDFIAYGSEIYTMPNKLPIELANKYNSWMKSFGLEHAPYYLMVGRFVPENNFELIIKEFMNSSSVANLVIISNVSDGALKERLFRELKINSDKRIKLVGTLYDQDTLKVIRASALGYIHGHEVGGTNPSLLEALGSTNINLVYDVSFNREVAQKAAFYFDSSAGNLSQLIEKVDNISQENAIALGALAKKRIETSYSWKKIINQYQKLFLR